MIVILFEVISFLLFLCQWKSEFLDNMVFRYKCKKHPEWLPPSFNLKECYQQDEGECFCLCLSTCSGKNRSLSAPSVTLSTFNEQELRLVTNLTKLRPVSSITQQALTLWLVAIMLSLPTGRWKGHKGRCRLLLETVAEPATHPWAL